MNKGIHENDYYVIGGAKVQGGGDTYWIMWLDTGEHTCGYETAEQARKAADRIVHNHITGMINSALNKCL